MTRIQQDLKDFSDPAYRDFQSRLIPNVQKETILGVRVPVLRKYAATLSQEEKTVFYADLPHRYYDENMLHTILLSRERDFSYCLSEVERFLPYIDNWAVCDVLMPKVFRKNKEIILSKAKEFAVSGETYTVRFGIDLLMTFFLDADFVPEIFDISLSVHSEEYYICMMLAWFYATALAKQWEATLPLLTEGKLSTWVHNKTIRKALESYRISDERKAFLRTLRR